MKQRLCVFSKRKFEFDSQKDNAHIIGWMYGAFMPDGTALEFSSRRDDIPVNNVVRFVDQKATEINLISKIFKGKVTFREFIDGVDKPDETG